MSIRLQIVQNINEKARFVLLNLHLHPSFSSPLSLPLLPSLSPSLLHSDPRSPRHAVAQDYLPPSHSLGEPSYSSLLATVSVVRLQ